MKKYDFQKAWEKFGSKQNFTNWKFNLPREQIIAEFYKLHKWRLNVWFSDPKLLIRREEFFPADYLLKAKRSVYEDIAAFSYNNTDPSYNSSSIIINNLHFLAMEAPRKHLLLDFFDLLKKYNVKCLVRLLQTHETDPYWKDILEKKEDFHVLNIPNGISLPYYFIDTWEDNDGCSPEKLLKLVLDVQKNNFPLIACHCLGGVGRTGTFIAAYAIVDALRKQKIQNEKIEISIEKIVAALSIQRFLMVAQANQYLTLYRLVDCFRQMNFQPSSKKYQN